MPLTRDNVTAASRIMLPTYVVFFAVLGANYLTTSLDPGQAALSYVDNLMDIRAWGCVFLACSTLMAGALISHRRILYRFALRFCAASMVVWACMIAAASIAGDATALAAVWAAFIATACIATDRSLATREV